MASNTAKTNKIQGRIQDFMGRWGGGSSGYLKRQIHRILKTNERKKMVLVRDILWDEFLSMHVKTFLILGIQSLIDTHMGFSVLPLLWR